MNWLEFLGTAAVGSLFGLLIKEGIDWLRTERNHRLELRKRFFDAKLDATIRIIREIKTSTANLKSFTSLIKANEDSGGRIHPNFLNEAAQNFKKTSAEIRRDTVGMSALIGFYYNDELARLISCEPPEQLLLPLLQKVTAVMSNIETLLKTKEVLSDIRVSSDDKKNAEMNVKFYEEQIKINSNEIAEIAEKLDNLANDSIKRMRQDFKGISF